MDFDFECEWASVSAFKREAKESSKKNLVIETIYSQALPFFPHFKFHNGTTVFWWKIFLMLNNRTVRRNKNELLGKKNTSKNNDNDDDTKKNQI